MANIKTLLHLKEKLGKITYMEKEALYYHNLGKTLTLNYLIAGFVVLFGFGIQPFVSGKLPATTYYPEEYFITFCIYYILSGCCVVITVVTTDALFCSLCTTVIIHFKNLKQKIQNVNKNKIWKQLKNIVDEQNLLLE